MLRSFKAVVRRGRIQPVERVKLREYAPLLVTVVDDEESLKSDWKKMSRWIGRQRKEKKYASYRSFESAKRHLSNLIKS